MLPLHAVHAGAVTLLPGSSALDLPTYLSWLRDQETTRHLEVNSADVSVEYAKSWLREIDTSKTDALFAISHTTLGTVGTIRLGPINWLTKESRVGLMVGESSARGRGVARQALQALGSWVAANGIETLWAGIRSANIASIRAFEAAGFIQCPEELASPWLPLEWSQCSQILIFKRSTQ